MPYRLGMPRRKFVCTFYDHRLANEGLPFEDCFIVQTFYDNAPENVLMMAEIFADNCDVELKSISEVYWEDILIND